MAIWGAWDMENIMNPAMRFLTTQITKSEYLTKGFISFK